MRTRGEVLAGIPSRLVWLLGALFCLIGCAGTRVTLLSADHPVALQPDILTAVYSFRDENRVEIYLTDLDPEQLRPDPDGALPASLPVGQITEVSMFVRPFPGRTPIDPTAANAVVRHAVFTGRDEGVYAGGGFFLPGSRAESGRFRARTDGTTLSLRSASRGFVDRLGPVRLLATFSATHDERVARLLRAALERAAQHGGVNPRSAPTLDE